MWDAQKRTWARVSLDNIEHNYREIRRVLPADCRFMAVVKADAYGHGAAEVSRRLESAGADYLGVACLDEAAELRRAGLRLPILILGNTPPVYADDLADLNVAQAVADEEQGLALAENLRSGKSLRVHIKLDTGMGRLGFRAKNGEDLAGAGRVMTCPGLIPEGVFTHLAVSDEFGNGFTAEQSARFLAAVRALEEGAGRSFKIKHCANSGAVVNYKELCMDMVRPGLLTYGLYPAAERGGLSLRPAMELKARVAAVARHKKGDTVSYGRTFTAQRDCTLAVIPVGYADGLHWVLSGKMDVLLRGVRVPQVGRICMDMCMLDVTELPGAAVGDVATVFGRDGDAVLPVEEQAEKAGTISYEMVCAVSKRVPRVYEE
jgi:alanine racemase